MSRPFRRTAALALAALVMGMGADPFGRKERKPSAKATRTADDVNERKAKQAAKLARRAKRGQA